MYFWCWRCLYHYRGFRCPFLLLCPVFGLKWEYNFPECRQVRNVTVLFVSVVEDRVGEPVWVVRCALVLWKVSCEIMIPGVVVSLCLCF